MLWRVDYSVKRLLSSITHMEFMNRTCTHTAIKTQINATKIQAIYLVLQLYIMYTLSPPVKWNHTASSACKMWALYYNYLFIFFVLSCITHRVCVPIFAELFSATISNMKNDTLRERRACACWTRAFQGETFNLLCFFKKKSNNTWKSYNRVVLGLSTNRHAMSACMVSGYYCCIQDWK